MNITTKTYRIESRPPGTTAWQDAGMGETTSLKEANRRKVRYSIKNPTFKVRVTGYDN